MISWKKQGAALVGNLTFLNGGQGNIVLVGPRQNPKGAVILVPGNDGRPQTILLTEALDLLDPASVVEIMCMQELGFGKAREQSHGTATGDS